MARPKKEAGDGKTISINYNDYMNMQNFLAQHLQVQHSMASRMMTAASSQLGAINATLQQVQSNTRNALQLSNIDESSVNPQPHPHIFSLLQTENALLAEPHEGLGELQLPTAPPLPKVQKKKQRKPKDPNAPKRPVTAFFLYLAENKDAMAKQLGPTAKPGEIQQRNKDMWNSLTEDKQEKYKQKYRENFENYRTALRDYQAQGGQIDPRMLEPDMDTIVPLPVPAKADDEEDDEEEEDDDDEESDDDSDEEPVPVPEPPKRASKAAAKPAKEASPDKKKKPEPKKKAAAAKDVPESSPDVSKKKRKADAADPVDTAAADDKKRKKKKKSAGYAGNADDY